MKNVRFCYQKHKSSMIDCEAVPCDRPGPHVCSRSARVSSLNRGTATPSLREGHIANSWRTAGATRPMWLLRQDFMPEASTSRWQHASGETLSCKCLIVIYCSSELIILMLYELLAVCKMSANIVFQAASVT